MLLRWLFCIPLAGALLSGCARPQTAAASAQPIAAAAQPAESQGQLEQRVEAHAHYAAAVIAELNGETNLALEEYGKAASADPTNESLILEVSSAFLTAKQPAKALEILRRATARPGASSVLLARLGSLYAHLGKWDLAIQTGRRALRQDPRRLINYQGLCLAYLQQHQNAKALAVLDEASKVPGVDAGFLVGLAELYGDFGLQVPPQKQAADARAVAVLERAEKLDSSDVPTRLRLADAWYHLGKSERAARIYQGLLATFADQPVARETIRSRLAEIYLRDENPARAAEQLQALVREDPTDARAWYFLGSLAYDATNYDRAAGYFSRTLTLDPDFEPAYYDLAAVNLARDKSADALALLQQASRKFSPNFLLEYLLGSAYGRQKDFTNAVNHFTTAEIIAGATDPKRLTDVFYFQFGAVCERAGHIQQAEKLFQKCLSLSPHFSEAQNYLGYMWAERGEKLEQARDLIQKAVEADPKNAAFLDSMGWVLLKLGKPRPALDYELKAVQFSDEPDAEIFEHLGDIYSALGQGRQARDAWRKSLSLQPNPTLEKKLEAGK